jgi:hypothetical protein
MSDGHFVPPWVPWPAAQCAFVGCGRRRVEAGRRWCAKHCARYRNEVKLQDGGAKVINMHKEQ